MQLSKKNCIYLQKKYKIYAKRYIFRTKTG